MLYNKLHRLVNWALTGDFGGLKEDELPVDQIKLLADLRRRNTVLICKLPKGNIAAWKNF